MGRKTYNPKQIINMLRYTEVLLSQGATLCVACRKIGVSEQTYYRWRKKYLEYMSEPKQTIQRVPEEVICPQ